MADEKSEIALLAVEPKKSRAELELERLQKTVAELQAQIEAEAKLAEDWAKDAKELALHLHDSFCSSKADACAICAGVLPDAVWSDEHHQYWLKGAAKVADFLTSKGWQKPQED